MALAHHLIAIALLGLAVSWLLLHEFSLAERELRHQIRRGHRLASSSNTSSSSASLRHVFFSHAHDHSASLSRRAALLHMPPSRCTVLYFPSVIGPRDAPVSLERHSDHKLSALFSLAMSLIPDAHTYTYYYQHDAVGLFAAPLNDNTSSSPPLLTMLDSAVIESSVSSREDDDLSPRFLVHVPGHSLTASRVLWDWSKLPSDSSIDVAWIVHKAKQLSPVISVVDGDLSSSSSVYEFNAAKWALVLVLLALVYPALAVYALPRLVVLSSSPSSSSSSSSSALSSSAARQMIKLH